ncbi:MAG TPA: 50S ribosomal protein L17 [Rhabdochlamydiaceae bacterium]|nr:50S ribosomal protein L17 [Rhabdochlamydiaceae bacterium]
MRHGKHTFKVGRSCGHRRSLIANMLKSLIEHERIETSETKAKELRMHADRMITMAKDNTLASKRRAIAKLMVSYNRLTPKEARAAKAGDTSAYNADRKLVDKLFNELSKRFATRNGGFTRIVKKHYRVGDNSLSCFIEFLPE